MRTITIKLANINIVKGEAEKLAAIVLLNAGYDITKPVKPESTND